MKFRERELTDQDREGRRLKKWESEGGVWRVSLEAMLWGVRCNVGRVDDAIGYELGYCCGDQAIAVLLTPALIMKALESFDETESIILIRLAFPVQQVKPLCNDGPCWRALCALAGVPALGDTLERARWGQ